MKSLMIMLAVGLAASDKLDRTYLPPPGSKFSGGRPGDLEVPLEYPKETYSTTLRPLELRPAGISSKDAQLTVGLDRGTGPNNPSRDPNFVSSTPEPKTPFTYFQNTYKVPTTTTSYAFTQTTTYAPPEGFETTVGPLGSEEFTVNEPFGDIQRQNGIVNYPQAYNQGQVRPGFIQTPQNISQKPGFRTMLETTAKPGFEYQSSVRDAAIPERRPSFQQTQTQDFNQHGLHPSSTISQSGQYTGSTPPPGFIMPSHFVPGVKHIGVQPPRQFIQQDGLNTLELNVPNQTGGYSPAQQGYPSQTTSNGGYTYLPGFSNEQRNFTSGPISQQTIKNQGTDQYGPQDSVSTIPSQNHVYQPGTAIKYGSNIIPQLVSQRPLRPGQNVLQQNFQPTTDSSQSYQPGFTFQNSDVNVPSNLNLPQQEGNRYNDINIKDSFLTTVAPQGSGLQQISGLPGLPNDDYNTPGNNLQNVNGLFTTQSNNQERLSYQPIPSSSPNIQGRPVPGSKMPSTGIYSGNKNLNQFIKPGSAQNQLTDTIFPTKEYPSSTSMLIPSSGLEPQRVYSPDFTTASSIKPPGYPNQPTFSTTTPGTFSTSFASGIGSSTTPNYSGVSSQNTVGPTSIITRPERPQAESDRNAVILSYENELTPEGYAYSFDTSNGIHADEAGIAIDGVKAKGSYSYIGDDGKLYSVVYSADENGFQPHGDHLPTSPPIPEAIQRIIDQSAKDKEAGIYHDGSYDEEKYGHKKYQRPRNRYHPQEQSNIVANGADVPEDFSENAQRPDMKKYISKESRPDDTVEDTFDENGNVNGQTNGGIVSGNSRQQTNKIKYPPNGKQEENQYENLYNEDVSVTQFDNNGQPVNLTTDKAQVRPGLRIPPTRQSLVPGRKQQPGSSINRDDGSQYKDLESTGNLEKVSGQTFPENYVQPTKYGSQNSPSGKTSSRRPVGSTPAPGPYRSDVVQTQNYVTYGRPILPSSGMSIRPSEEISTDEMYYQEPGTFDLQEQTLIGRPEGTNLRPGLSSKYDFNKRVESRPQLTSGFNPDSKIVQNNINRPPQQPGLNKYIPQQSNVEDIGYEYTPPANKFEQGEKNRFPSRFTDFSTTRKPTKELSIPISSTRQPQYDVEEKQTTAQPFMTPNVSRGDEIGSDERSPARKPDRYKVTYNENDYETDYDNGPDYETVPGPEKGTGNKIYLSQIPVQIDQGSHRRRPSYGETISEQKNNVYTTGTNPRTQEVSGRPGQKIDIRYPDTTEVMGRPVQKNISRPGPRKPVYNIVSTTTPMLSPIPTRFDSTPESYQDSTKFQYPKTYDRDNSVSESYNITTTPGKVSLKPGQRIPNRPTSAPTRGYPGSITTTGSTTASPQFSRPSTPGFSTSVGPASDTYSLDFSDKTSSPVSTTTRPGFSVNGGQSTIDYETGVPESDTARTITTIRPGRPSFSGQTSLPSTTYRPNYAATDGTTVSGGEPGMMVDEYGQPINQYGQFVRPGQDSQPGQYNQPRGDQSRPSGLEGSTTYRPEYYTSTQGSILPMTSGQTQQSFRPNESRFGKPEYEYQGPLSGQKPYGGPQTTLRPYGGQTSGQRVIGEDFSGPKQPQRFDPATGYHY